MTFCVYSDNSANFKFDNNVIHNGKNNLFYANDGSKKYTLTNNLFVDIDGRDESFTHIYNFLWTNVAAIFLDINVYTKAAYGLTV
jgi:hypothetical protein